MGSGVVNDIGPAAVLTYVLAGALIVPVIRMLGEMAPAQPATGSFARSPDEPARAVVKAVTVLAIVAILVSMYFGADSRSQLLMSLLAWGVALLAYAAGRALRSGRRDAPDTADVAVE